MKKKRVPVRRFTRAQIDWFKAHYEDTPIRKLAEGLGVKLNVVWRLIIELGMPARMNYAAMDKTINTPIKEADFRWIKRNCVVRTISEMAAELNRPRETIYRICATYGFQPRRTTAQTSRMIEDDPPAHTMTAAERRDAWVEELATKAEANHVAGTPYNVRVDPRTIVQIREGRDIRKVLAAYYKYCVSDISPFATNNKKDNYL